MRDGLIWLIGLLWALLIRTVRWFRKYGLALLVLLAIAGAAFLATRVAVPEPVPDFALRSKEIYRLEIGAAFFVVFYLSAMSFVLALSGRGFVQIGTQGVATDDVVVDRKQNLAFRTLTRSIRSALTGIGEMRDGLRKVDRTLESHERRLEELERQRRTTTNVSS